MGIYDRKYDYMQRYYQESTQPNDHQYVYLVQAIGYHGVLSRLKLRCKIGLTNNVNRRLKELNSAQAPCPVKKLECIEVEDNVKVEAKLHRQFANHRVYGEWFDFWTWEMWLVLRAYKHHQSESRQRCTNKYKSLATTLAVIVAIALIAFVLGRGLRRLQLPDNIPNRQETITSNKGIR